MKKSILNVDRGLEVFNVGDSVVVTGVHICSAPYLCIGEEGVVVEVLNGVVDGITYENKLRVLFPEEIKETYKSNRGYRDWLFDFSEVTSSSL
jgi:hypothetical protein